MSAPSLSAEAALAKGWPSQRFNDRERQLLASVKTYVDAAAAAATPAADSVTNAKIADTAVSLEHLDSGIAPSHVVKYAGKATTVGGAAAEAITVTGVAATDIVLVTLQTEGAVARSIVKAVPSTDTITVTFSGDPANDHIVAYQVLRAAT